MLIVHKVKHRPSAIVDFEFLLWCEQVSNIIFGKHGASEYSHNFTNIPIEFEVMLDDSHKAICNDYGVDLNIDGIHTVTPKGLDPEVLFYELEEKFHRPSVLVKERDVFGRKIEVVRVIRECPFESVYIEHNTSDYSWIMLFVSLGSESHSLVSEDTIIPVEHVLALYDFILWLSLLPNDKEGVQVFNFEEPCQIPITTVKDVACQWLIFYPVHGIDIIHGCFRDGKHHRYKGNDIDLRMHFDSCLAAFESCPVKDRQAKAYGCGVERIILAIELKRLAFPLPLGYVYHVVCHLLKYMVISLVVGIRKRCPFNRFTAKTKMIRLVRMGIGNVCKFSKTTASIKLTEDKHQKLIPRCQALCFSFVITLSYKLFEVSFWKEVYHLTEDISAVIHMYAHFYTLGKGNQFKCATRFSG